MSKTSYVNFKAVKQAISMVKVLEHYGLMDSLKRYNDNLSGPCPIHKGSNPTQFRVSLSKNLWNCFGNCKHGGNALDFIAKMENVSIHSAANKAIEWFQLDPATPDTDKGSSGEEPEKPCIEEPKAEMQTNTLSEKETPNKPLKFRLEKLEKDHPYLLERGLDPKTIEEFDIGYCGKGVMAGRIAIPIRNIQGEVVAYAGRLPGEPDKDVPKYKFPQGFRKSLELFNLDRALKENGPLYVVEGFFDCMFLHQHGIRKVIALMGSSLSSGQEELLRAHTDENTQVILMLDEDDAGKTARENIAARLAKFLFVKIHTFDKEGQQPDSLSTEEIENLLN